MAVSNYCTVEEVRAFVRDPDMNMTVLGLIMAPISRAIDGYCRRYFYSLDGSELYDRKDPYEIRLRKDLASITSVTDTSGQSFDSDDFYYEPLGGLTFSRIMLKQESGTFGYTTSIKRAITVTGAWGYAAVPDDIKLAAMIWSADAYQKSDVAGLEAISSDAVSATMQRVADPRNPPDNCLLYLNMHLRVRIKAIG